MVLDGGGGGEHRYSRRCKHLPLLSLIKPYPHWVLARTHSRSLQLKTPTLGPMTCAKHGFQSRGIHNLESSKFPTIGENEQMDSNCRPVVGTLLTNTQVAVYRAFWNRMQLGSWGRQSNYQHLSFLFNEGECGKQPCLQQQDRKRCQGCGSPTSVLSVATASHHPVFPAS